jgi:RNA polymerase sigma-70 factor, ECF subfamily
MTTDDIKLLREARQGDEVAFLELYYQHRTPLFRFAYRLTASVAAAEDVTQECFLALLKGSGFDSRRGSFRTYLFGIVRNLAMKHVRLTERETKVMPDKPAPTNPLRDLLSHERASLVEKAVGELPLLQKEALILFEYEEMSLNDIACITSVDVGAVKARLHRARESLRQRLLPVLAERDERSAYE